MMNETADPVETRGEDAADAAGPVASETEPPAIPGAAPGKTLSPEAIRALQEAEARRQAAPPQTLPPEINGRDGEEPTRYGDWEKKGMAVDF
ncbi:MAG: DUF1674 domain-containing protein [Hyphomonadaceae bacterium]|nr:DUF1674 domain-containing protein [Hyphomonadaceae bacterium]